MMTARGDIPRDQSMYLRMTKPEKRRLHELAVLHSLNGQNLLRLLVKQAYDRLIEEPRRAKKEEEDVVGSEENRRGLLRSKTNEDVDAFTTRLLSDYREVGGDAHVVARSPKRVARSVRRRGAPAKSRKRS